MKHIQVSNIGYLRLCDRLKGNLRVELDKIGTDPYMTRAERAEVLHKAFNPDVPMSITLHTYRGSFYITRKFI